MKGKTGHGVKRAEQRIILLLAANMIGTEKLPLIITEQFQNQGVLRAYEVCRHYTKAILKHV